MENAELKTRIEAAWEARETLNKADPVLREAVEAAIRLLDEGKARVAEPIEAGLPQSQHPVAAAALGHPAHRWQVNQWLKMAVLLYFRLHDNQPIEMGSLHGYDKVPLKFNNYDRAKFAALNVRVVPPAAVRRGAYIAPGAVLMPSYVNIGAHVGAGTMVDTWASIGSCSQIGANCHISAGAGIGGVLEPLQANPTIIEDDCFIGARSEVVEGVIVGKGSVISMGVFITQSTPIYQRETGQILYGQIPPGSVVVAGSLPKDGGKYNLSCAVIVKTVDEKTRSKVGINALLRDL